MSLSMSSIEAVVYQVVYAIISNTDSKEQDDEESEPKDSTTNTEAYDCFLVQEDGSGNHDGRWREFLVRMVGEGMKCKE